MTDTRIADIRKTLEFIRADELKPGYRVNATTTLRTCPADLNRIGLKLDEIEKDLAAARTPAPVVGDGKINVEWTCCGGQEYWDLNERGELEMTHAEMGCNCDGSALAAQAVQVPFDRSRLRDEIAYTAKAIYERPRGFVGQVDAPPSPSAYRLADAVIEFFAAAIEQAKGGQE